MCTLHASFTRKTAAGGDLAPGALLPTLEHLALCYLATLAPGIELPTLLALLPIPISTLAPGSLQPISSLAPGSATNYCTLLPILVPPAQVHLYQLYRYRGILYDCCRTFLDPGASYCTISLWPPFQVQLVHLPPPQPHLPPALRRLLSRFTRPKIRYSVGGANSGGLDVDRTRISHTLMGITVSGEDDDSDEDLGRG